MNYHQKIKVALLLQKLGLFTQSGKIAEELKINK